MGFAPENIRVLTSPRLAPEGLGPECVAANVGEATRDEMMAGLTWLYEVIDGDEPCSGLMTFSGHGTRDRGLLLCPSDVTGSLDEAISVVKLRRKANPELSRRLTVLIDGCHAQVGLGPEKKALADLLTERAGVELPDNIPQVSARVIAACERDQTSDSSTFGGKPIGAFTWALISAMGRWPTSEMDGVRYLAATHGQLVAQAQALLQALSFDQEPTLSGPSGIDEQAFLAPGDAPVSSEPSGSRTQRQLDVDINPQTNQQYDSVMYTFLYSKNGDEYKAFAKALAMGKCDKKYDGKSYAANTEYWYQRQDESGRPHRGDRPARRSPPRSCRESPGDTRPLPRPLARPRPGRSRRSDTRDWSPETGR